MSWWKNMFGGSTKDQRKENNTRNNSLCIIKIKNDIEMFINICEYVISNSCLHSSEKSSNVKL